MKAATVRVNFAKAVPRTIWYRSDVLPVIFAFVVAATAISFTYNSLNPILQSTIQQTAVLHTDHLRSTARATQIQSQLAALQAIQATQPSMIAARHSGLVVAQQLVRLGDSLARDGVATHISSAGEIVGVANDFDALSRIWGRLGTQYGVVSADPLADGTVSFTIDPVPVPTAVPVAPRPLSTMDPSIR
jgi:hypothetical protein